MSAEKPRVYQGVRVNNPVKELLQRHRAREASSKKLKTAYAHPSTPIFPSPPEQQIFQVCLELQELCASTSPSRHVDPPSVIPPAHSSCGARAVQLRTAAFPESSCSIQMQDGSFNDIQQQFGDVMLPGNSYGGNNINNPSGGISFSASLPPPTASPLPWSHGLSSDADYYGHGMAPCSSSESLAFCNPMDHNSYSPQDSFSSSSSSCYDSPTRMESSYRGFPSELYHYQHCTPQDCYCLPHCWPAPQESFTVSEYAPCYNPTDLPYVCPVEENYFRRDLPVSSEMCYNVL